MFDSCQNSLIVRRSIQLLQLRSCELTTTYRWPTAGTIRASRNPYNNKSKNTYRNTWLGGPVGNSKKACCFVFLALFSALSELYRLGESIKRKNDPLYMKGIHSIPRVGLIGDISVTFLIQRRCEKVNVRLEINLSYRLLKQNGIEAPFSLASCFS